MGKRRSGKSTKSGKSTWKEFNEKRRLERQLARKEALLRSRQRICGKRNPVALEVQALRRLRREEAAMKVDAAWAPPVLQDDAEAEFH